MKKIWVLVFILFINACCFHSPNATFYMMNSDGLEAISSKKLSVSVKSVKVPELLNKQQLVIYKKDSNEVNILEFSRWGENLPFVLQNVITNDLMVLLPNSFIKSTKFANDNQVYNVSVEINKIEAIPGDKVKIYVWWNIDSKNGVLLKRKQAEYEYVVNGNSIDELVKSENQAMHLLSKDIASTLVKF
jgi:uncharacterized lipoprotein YmbA